MPRSTRTEAYAVMTQLLQQLRNEQGLTQRQLAERLGKPQAFVSTIESGARRIDVVEFCALARVLGADPMALFAEVVRRLPDRIDI
jgi:transcriptional regulator with XRE-family HTH domain